MSLKNVCAVALGSILVTGCFERGPPGYGPVLGHAGSSPSCSALTNFFRANIEKSWSAGLNITGNGGHAEQKQIVAYERLATEESKRQMALASVACEQFEAGELGTGDAAVERYLKLLEQSIDAGVKVSLLKGGDPEQFLREFQSAVGAAQVGATGNREQLDKLVAGVNKAITDERQRLPDIAEDAQAARKSADAAREYALELIDSSSAAEQMIRELADANDNFRGQTVTQLSEIKSALELVKRKLGVAEANAQAGAPTMRSQRWPVFFTASRADPDRRYMRSLPDAVRDFRTVQNGAPVRAIVEGYTDQSGPAQANQLLSERRAHAVAELLRKAGLSDVTEIGRGETSEFGTASVNRVVYYTLIVGP